MRQWKGWSDERHALPTCEDPQLSDPTWPAPEEVVNEPLKIQLETFLDQHRLALDACLDGLTEQQARRSLVPSKTTLLGLVKHTTFVHKVWFDEAVTCRSRDELGIPAGPDESFDLDDEDTIATVRQAFRQACEASRQAVAHMDVDELVHGTVAGPCHSWAAGRATDARARVQQSQSSTAAAVHDCRMLPSGSPVKGS